MSAKMVVNVVRNSFLFVLLLFIIIFPQGVFGHAMLEQSIPDPDSQLDSSPTDIRLVFNERLEKELFYIKVFDGQGQSVTENPTEMSQDQKELFLPLPSLGDDIYTVTYNVISADGHPIRGSYVITVGAPSSTTDKTDQLDLANGQNSDWIQIGTFGIRIIYFLSLLLITGWIAWGVLFSLQSRVLPLSYQAWTRYLQTFYLVSLIAMAFVQMENLLPDWSLEGIKSLLFNTFTGVSLTISLLLSLIGFFILRKNRWVDAVWIILLLQAKSLSGHAMAFDPPFRTFLLDFLHLLGSSIWVGGLFYILLFWKTHQEQVIRFLPVFSRTALISMVVLTITGILSTSIFLPKVGYLLETSWGYLLLAKLSLVGLVIVVGAILRQKMKMNLMNRMGTWLKTDMILMLSIVGIVGVFTYLSPLPTNKPLDWEVRGESVHMTTHITPNSPGLNHFSVKVSLPRKDVQIKQTELFLNYEDDPEIAPIKVPLKMEPSQRDGYHFYSEGSYLPLAGNWTIEIRMMDSEDNETVYAKPITIY